MSTLTLIRLEKSQCLIRPILLSNKEMFSLKQISASPFDFLLTSSLVRQIEKKSV